MDVARLRTINCKVHIKDRYIGSFIIYMYTSLVAAVLCCCAVVLLWEVGLVCRPPHPTAITAMAFGILYGILSKEEFGATCIPVEMGKVWSPKLL